jgi:hypothetical protein
MVQKFSSIMAESPIYALEQTAVPTAPPNKSWLVIGLVSYVLILRFFPPTPLLGRERRDGYNIANSTDVKHRGAT